MPLKIYDIEIDGTREVTQADIDMLTAVQQAYGKLRHAIAQTHVELMAEVERVKRRGKPLVETPEVTPPA
jgi:hypothetical protein